MKPTKFATTTIKELCHPSHPTDFFTTQILGGHVTSHNQGLSPNDKGRQSLGTRLQILALLLVFHQNSQLVAQQICSCHSKSANQRAAFLQPATNVFVATQGHFIIHGEKRETSTKTCNGTMLRDKLKVFVSRISPPLSLVHTCAIARLGPVLRRCACYAWGQS